LYTNLITSAVGLTPRRLHELCTAGLDHNQVSLQADETVTADGIAAAPVHVAKLAAIAAIRHSGLAWTLNVVLHAANIDRVEQLIALAERLEAPRLELANVQFYGWAVRNRESIVPTREQIVHAEAIAAAAAEPLRGTMRIAFVAADDFEAFPKPCMNGWDDAT
jgi:pyrroloquinoline quinone biosynthesis protein E